MGSPTGVKKKNATTPISPSVRGDPLMKIIKKVPPIRRDIFYNLVNVFFGGRCQSACSINKNRIHNRMFMR